MSESTRAGDLSGGGIRLKYAVAGVSGLVGAVTVAVATKRRRKD